MNPKSVSLVFTLTALSLKLAFGDPLGTAFTYQGRLATGTNLANGRYDLTFSVWSAATGASQLGATLTNAAVPVSNGLFTVTLDFGSGIFDSNARWLEIGVRTNSVGSFVTLSPRQELTATPYALYAPNAGAAVQAATLPAGAVTTAMLADGAVTTSKIGAAAVKPANIDDGGSAFYEAMREAARPLSTTEALLFSELSPVTGEPPSLVLALDGAALGTAVGFIGREGMSAPFEYVVEVVIPAADLDPAAQLGRQARLTFARNGRSTRFAGLVTACALSSYDGKSARYTFRIEPPLAFLTLTTDYRVYQDQAVPAIVSGVYQNLTSNTLSQSFVQEHAIRPCTIQYGETALNFFNRLLEDEGIFYFFTAGSAAVTLADGVQAYLAAPNSPFAYYGNDFTEVPVGAEYVRRFGKATRESIKATQIAAYDFTHPALHLSGRAESGVGRGEYYQFGSSAGTVPALTAQALLRQDRQQVERATMFGLANAPDLRPGYTFELDDRTDSRLRGAYLVTSVRHSAFRRVTNGVPTFYYGNQLEVIPADIVYRPAVRTPKPPARACIANVTGPTGEDRAFVDEYGRVKVQFRWDRYGVSDQNSSAWIRVATPMAGASHGMMFLPRVGDEVLVDFLQGDPDQPVVIGSFYNAQNMPPYSLPANKEISTIKSRSKSGHINEIQFNDTDGAEGVKITGAKDVQLAAGADLLVTSAKYTLGANQGVVINTTNQGVIINAASVSGAALNVDGLVGANAFQGDGSALNNLPAAALTGTINDARLSLNIARLNATQSFSGINTFLAPVGIGGAASSDLLNIQGSARLNEFDLYLRGNNGDVAHGLGWYGSGKPFGGVNVDGPVLYGFSGGALGAVAGGLKTVLLWNYLGNVGIGTNSPGAKLDVAGTFRADSVSGDGAGLANLNASNLAAGTIPAARLPANAALQNVDASFANLRASGLLRSGSETGTSQLPNRPGLVIRRVNSTTSSSGQIVARTDVLTLERDSSTSGLLIRYPVSPGVQTINGLGISNTGVLVPVHFVLNSPATAGTLALFTDAQRIVHAQIAFGNTYNAGHMTQVVLDRCDDGSSINDNFWIGAVISTYNQ